MGKMTTENFIEFAHSQLSLIENDLGEVVYSAANTLKKGKYYFLGLNPGGDGFTSIRKHLNEFPMQTTNSFFDKKWKTSLKNYEKGQNPLQIRIQYLFKELLHYNLRDIFATNLIFKTTKNSNTLNFGLAGLCWAVHLFALNIIQPEIIVTCGNEKGKSAFYFISDLYSNDNNKEKNFIKYELQGTFAIKVSEVEIQNRRTLLIGLPHLSRYEIQGNELFNKRLKEIAEKYPWINS